MQGYGGVVNTTITGRDLAVVQQVAKFHQLSSKHIYDLLFHSLTYRPHHRALRRLVAAGYLRRIERRMVGGSRGGSGQYIYCLGRRGFYLHFTGRYTPARAVNYHALTIADCYVLMKQLERQGKLEIAGFSSEPDCWVNVGGVQLKPDLYVDLGRLRLWLEVDMGTEPQRQIRIKLETYWRAYEDADVDRWPVFPQVLFVAVDDERATELAWLIGQAPERQQPLFDVCTLETLDEKLTADV